MQGTDKSTRPRWLVICDDEREEHNTRSQARKAAAEINRHPANRDIRRHGGYRNVDGVARVIDRNLLEGSR